MAVVETFQDNLQALQTPAAPAGTQQLPEAPATGRGLPAGSSGVPMVGPYDQARPDRTTGFEVIRPDTQVERQLPRSDVQVQRTGNPLQDILRLGEESQGALRTPFEEAQVSFVQQAGPARTFTPGMEETLRGAAEGEYGGSASEAALGRQQAARDILTTQYQGPQTLQDVYDTANLYQRAQEIEDLGQTASRGGTELMGLIQEYAPGWTPGMARWEVMNRSPEFRNRAQDIARAGQRWEGQIQGAEERAQEYAAQRAQQEADIREKSREFLGGLSQEQEDAIQAQIDAEFQRQTEVEDAYELAKRLMGQAYQREQSQYEVFNDPRLAEYLPEGFDPEVFNIQVQKDATEAQRLKAEIDARFPDVPSTPTQFEISHRGHEDMIVPNFGFASTPGGAPFREGATAKVDPKRVKARDEEYRKAGLLPGSGKDPTAGKYYPFVETWLDQAFQGPDLSQEQYLSWDPGVRPSRQNVSTEQQRAVINDINELLGQLETVGEFVPPKEEFRQAMLEADVGKYIEDELAALKKHKGVSSERLGEWQKALKAQRHRYNKLKKARRKKLGTTIGTVLGYVSPLGVGGPAGAGVGGAVGGAVGSALG